MYEEEVEFFEPERDVSSNMHSHVFDANARVKLSLQMLKHLQQSLAHVIQLLEEGDSAQATRDMVHLVLEKKSLEQKLELETGNRIVEGIFDGVSMMTPDGIRYLVPENYASKSKLVEGDMMKLLIRSDGRHIFKQIGPVERKRVVGVLGVDTVMNTPVVIVNEDMYKVLSASVTYFKAVPGDEVVILVPGNGKSVWAALERVVSQ